MRQTLPQRRESILLTFDHEGMAYIASVSTFEDGTIAELFLNAGKPDSAADKNAHDAAVLYSIARQWGVPHETLYDALAKLQDGAPAGAIGVALSKLAESSVVPFTGQRDAIVGPSDST